MAVDGALAADSGTGTWSGHGWPTVLDGDTGERPFAGRTEIVKQPPADVDGAVYENDFHGKL